MGSTGAWPEFSGQARGRPPASGQGAAAPGLRWEGGSGLEVPGRKSSSGVRRQRTTGEAGAEGAKGWAWRGKQ